MQDFFKKLTNFRDFDPDDWPRCIAVAGSCTYQKGLFQRVVTQRLPVFQLDKKSARAFEGVSSGGFFNETQAVFVQDSSFVDQIAKNHQNWPHLRIFIFADQKSLGKVSGVEVITVEKIKAKRDFASSHQAMALYFGVKIQADALAECVRYKEDDWLSVENVYRNLSLAFGDTSVTRENIVPFLNSPADKTIFELRDHLMGASYASSLEFLRYLSSQGHEVLPILGFMAKHCRLVLGLESASSSYVQRQYAQMTRSQRQTAQQLLAAVAQSELKFKKGATSSEFLLYAATLQERNLKSS